MALYYRTLLPAIIGMILCSCTTRQTIERLELHSVVVANGAPTPILVSVEESVPEQLVANTHTPSMVLDAPPHPRELQLIPAQTILSLSETAIYQPRLTNNARLNGLGCTVVNASNHELISPEGLLIRNVSASPDGNNLCFAALDTPKSTWTIWILNLANKIHTPLVRGESPTWLNDDTLAFQAPKGTRQVIWQIDTDGSRRHILLESSEVDFIHPSFHPSLGILAYVREAGLPQSRDIWLHHMNEEPDTQLTSHPARDDVPIWSADGKSLFFRSTRNCSWSVYKIILPPVDQTPGGLTRSLNGHNTPKGT